MTEDTARAEDAEGIARDARQELWLIPQALIALAVTVAVVVIRELVLR